jgi:proton-translocating NADH-quinone oxidoreductase chain N
MTDHLLTFVVNAEHAGFIFGPTGVFLVGVIALWFQIVWLAGYTATVSPLWMKSWTSPQPFERVQRYWYYHAARKFDSRFSGTIVKGNLLMLLLFTLAAELFVNSPILTGVGATDYFSSMLNHSMLTYCMKLAILFFALLTVAFVDEHEPGMSAAALGLVAAIIFFMLVLVSANHLIVLYVALEGISLLAFVLAAYTKTATSVESGIKYFFQSSFASAILLLGIATIFIGTQEFNFMALRYDLLEHSFTSLTSTGVMLITIAFLFKVSGWPGHFWSPDVYRGPLTSIVNVFAVGIKLAAFCGLILLHVNLLVMTSYEINWLLYLSAAASLVIGMLGALRSLNEDGDIRSFLAYTSINQVGFILMGLVCVNLEGLVASLVYLITYLLASVLFIGVISRLRFITEAGERGFTKFADFKHLYVGQHRFSRRADSFVLAFAVWSMAGLPPLAGFVGKLAIWTAMIHRIDAFLTGCGWDELVLTFPYGELDAITDPIPAYAFLLILSVIVSLVSATYYFKLYDLMSPPASNAELASQPVEASVQMVHDVGSLLSVGLLVVLIVTWIGSVSWTYGQWPVAYPHCLLELGGTWQVSFGPWHW